MRTISLFGFVLMFVAMTSCDKPVEETQYHFPIVALNQCSDTSIVGHSVKICFDSVYDSRCPSNMECFWQGEATAKLSLQTEGKQQFFKLSTLNNPPAFRNDTTLLGYKIKLLSVSPYPGNNTNTPYRVELSVTR